MNLDIFLQIALSVGAAFLGAWLALYRYRTERWWERKADSYTALIEALHDMSRPQTEIFEVRMRGDEITPDMERELWATFKQAKKRVWLIADTVDFIISPEVFEAIQKMRNGLVKARDAHDFYTHLEQTGEAVNACMDEVKRLGAKELGIRNRSGR